MGQVLAERLWRVRHRGLRRPVGHLRRAGHRSVATRCSDGVGPAAWRDMCLVATGGWGRREVCPHSDIDLLLLAPPKLAEVARAARPSGCSTRCGTRGVRVGHAVREPAACGRSWPAAISPPRPRCSTRATWSATASSHDELARGTRRAVAPGGNPNQFVAKLAAESSARHDRFGDSLYLLEPNLKQGIGALRDLATALWAARARWAVRELDELVAQGQLSARQAGLLREARDFLLRLRSLVQLARRRADRSADLRDPGGDRAAPVSATHAARRARRRPAGGGARGRGADARLLPARPRGRAGGRSPARGGAGAGAAQAAHPPIDASFLLWNGELAVVGPGRVPRAARARWCACSASRSSTTWPSTATPRELVAERLAVAPGRRWPATPRRRATSWPRCAMCATRASRRVLEQMHQLGVLAAVMPEFAPCTCRVQHDLYHVYTVDQHQLYAVAMLKRIAARRAGRRGAAGHERGRRAGRGRPLARAVPRHAAPRRRQAARQGPRREGGAGGPRPSARRLGLRRAGGGAQPRCWSGST